MKRRETCWEYISAMKINKLLGHGDIIRTTFFVFRHQYLIRDDAIDYSKFSLLIWRMLSKCAELILSAECVWTKLYIHMLIIYFHLCKKRLSYQHDRGYHFIYRIFRFKQSYNNRAQSQMHMTDKLTGHSLMIRDGARLSWNWQLTENIESVRTCRQLTCISELLEI